MSDAWIIAESFERTHQLISAINTVSIHMKLKLAGHSDDERVAEADASREVVRRFLSSLATLIPELEENPNAPLPGYAPRVGLFARRFVQERHRNPTRSPLLSLPVDQFASLLDADAEQDQRSVIEGLGTLREMLEQHHHSEATGVLGEL
jgi:hypothetical protein